MLTKILGGFALVIVFAVNILAATSPDTQLVQAIKNRDQKMAEILLKQSERAEVNARDAEGMTALLWAAHWDDLNMVKLLISAGADVKVTNRFGSTPLHEAATFGDCLAMEALLKAGADVNAVRGEGDTPLHVAARVGNPEAVKILLDHGATVDSREDWLGETPLMIAAAGNYAEVVKLLIDHGANVNTTSTAFIFRTRPMVDATTNIDPAMGGLTPLHFAIREDAIDAAKVLIGAGAKLDATDQDLKFTPLLTAVTNFHYDMAALLIEKGAQVNDESLFVTAFLRTRPLTEWPFPENLDVTSLSAIKLLIEHGADPNVLWDKSFPGTYKYVRVPRGATPYNVAIESLDLPAMQALAEKGARPLPTRNGTTALMQVAQRGPDATLHSGQPATDKDVDETIEFCLKNGVDVNAVDNVGNSAMHFAAGSGFDHFIQYLTAHGAKLDLKNKNGETPLQWAEGKYVPVNRGLGGGIEDRPPDAHDSTATLIQKLMISDVASR